jgi:very-short-patch-repair endonuclease
VRRKIIRYNPWLKDFARNLRRNMTHAEVLVWNGLKKKQMLGRDFDRQRPIDAFIVDFYCKDLMLAIEVDGESHNAVGADAKDRARQDRLESLGVRFLRFTDEDVKQNLDGVLQAIRSWVRAET